MVWPFSRPEALLDNGPMRWIGRLLTVLTLVSGADAMGTPTPDWRAHTLVDFYARVCAQNVGRPDLLAKAMAKLKGDPVPEAEIKRYVRGAGQAWRVKNNLGDVVVSLRSDGLCAVHGRGVNALAVQERFEKLVREATPSGVILTQLRKAPSKEASFRAVAFSWGKVGSVQQIVFNLMVHSNAEEPLQAMLSVALLD